MKPSDVTNEQIAREIMGFTCADFVRKDGTAIEVNFDSPKFNWLLLESLRKRKDVVRVECNKDSFMVLATGGYGYRTFRGPTLIDAAKEYLAWSREQVQP